MPELTGHIGIICDHFKFFTDKANHFFKIFIHFEFRKIPELSLLMAKP